MQAGNKTGKHLQVDKAKTMIFVIVAAASVVTVGSLMISRSLWQNTSYMGKVAEKRESARDQLEKNKVAVAALAESYQALVDENPNLLGGVPDGQGERDGNNATLILDALPNKYDFPALASSLEKLLTGYSINGIEGVDDSIIQQTAEASGPVDMPFGVEVVTTYDSFKNLIGSFRRSIRPIAISKLELSGTNAALQVSIEAKTFYQPQLGLQITEESVR